MAGVNNATVGNSALSESCKAPKSLNIPLDFTTASQFTFDTKPVIDAGGIDSVLGLYIDNRANSARIDILCSGTLQTISVPAGAQMYMPLLTIDKPQFTFTTTGNKLAN